MLSANAHISHFQRQINHLESFTRFNVTKGNLLCCMLEQQQNIGHGEGSDGAAAAEANNSSNCSCFVHVSGAALEHRAQLHRAAGRFSFRQHRVEGLRLSWEWRCAKAKSESVTSSVREGCVCMKCTQTYLHITLIHARHNTIALPHTEGAAQRIAAKRSLAQYPRRL